MQKYWPGEFLTLFSQNKVKVVFYDHKTHPNKNYYFYCKERTVIFIS